MTCKGFLDGFGIVGFIGILVEGRWVRVSDMTTETEMQILFRGRKITTSKISHLPSQLYQIHVKMRQMDLKKIHHHQHQDTNPYLAEFLTCFLHKDKDVAQDSLTQSWCWFIFEKSSTFCGSSMVPIFNHSKPPHIIGCSFSIQMLQVSFKKSTLQLKLLSMTRNKINECAFQFKKLFVLCQRDHKLPKLLDLVVLLSNLILNDVSTFTVQDLSSGGDSTS